MLIATCSNCGMYEHELQQSSKKLSSCRCKLARYCGKECQNQDWKIHRKHCRAAGIYKREIEELGLVDRDRAACHLAFEAHYKKVEVALKYMAHSALFCHHPNDRHRTHALVLLWEWVAPGTTLDTVKDAPYSNRDFVLASPSAASVVATRDEFNDVLRKLMNHESFSGEDFSVEGMNAMSNLGHFDASYRRIPVAMIGLHGGPRPIIFTSGIAVNINPHLNPYPIDEDWFEHFRKEAALPKALVWEDHFESRLRAMSMYTTFMREVSAFASELVRTGESQGATAFLIANLEEGVREDAYLANKKAKENAKKKARKARAKARTEGADASAVTVE